MSIEDVAAELKLSHFQIQALEDDDWATLPGTTYARGYLRSYARLLGLDAERLLAGANTQEIEVTRGEPVFESGDDGEDPPVERDPAPAAPEPDTLPTAAPAPEPGPERPSDTASAAPEPGRRAPQRASEPPEPAAEVEPDPGRAGGAGILIIVAVVAILGGAFLWQSPDARQWAQSLFGAGSADGGPQQVRQTEAERSLEAQRRQAETRRQREQAESVNAAEEIEMAGLAAEDAAPMPTVPDRVVFQFDERSWIDVRDARGERLLYRNFRPGRRIEVEGEPPFRVYLGNARGVKVEYMGEVMEPERASGGSYARFELNAPAG